MRRRALFQTSESCIWRTEFEIVQEFGHMTSDLGGQLRLWKARRKIFSINLVGGCELYADYIFDLKDCIRPQPALAVVLRILSEKRDNWGIATWFASHNGWLGGVRPIDKLACDPKLVIAAARLSLLPIMHG
jgi:hypothetical protein